MNNSGGGIVYPKLSYTINGILFDVHNQIGGNHPEKYYQKGVAAILKEKGLSFQEQYHVPLMVNNTKVGKYYLDFLVEGKVIIELKRGRYIPKNVYMQTKKYLTALNLDLAIIACFSHDCVVIKRILNLY